MIPQFAFCVVRKEIADCPTHETRGTFLASLLTNDLIALEAAQRECSYVGKLQAQYITNNCIAKQRRGRVTKCSNKTKAARRQALRCQKFCRDVKKMTAKKTKFACLILNGG